MIAACSMGIRSVGPVVECSPFPVGEGSKDIGGVADIPRQTCLGGPGSTPRPKTHPSTIPTHPTRDRAKSHYPRNRLPLNSRPASFRRGNGIRRRCWAVPRLPRMFHHGFTPQFYPGLGESQIDHSSKSRKSRRQAIEKRRYF